MKPLILSHKTSCRVIYGDTDNMGFAYYANYLRWFEIGRTELLRAWGLPYSEIEPKGVLLPVAEAQCKYHTPAKYDDLLTIEAALDAAYKGGLKIDYRILSQDEKILHATGYTRHAYMNPQGRVVRPPKFMRDLIQVVQPNTEPC
jgi:acyl-CoA thioester hydrolase